MTFSAFQAGDVRQAIDDLAAGEDLAVFVGAGVSAEAGLPTWPVLIERLLGRAAAAVRHFDDNDQRREWVSVPLGRSFLPGQPGLRRRCWEQSSSTR